ncbi:MAG: type VI secretion system protein TssA [Deltaproteobacteria bacterium]|nr:type VI secretion system protein TssA [Deltaproteobacteria bacterium]
MGSIDAEKLLEPISAEQPSGDDLEYDPAFAELERVAKGKLEQQFGDTIIPAEEPDWRDVQAKALDLLHRTKDLRVGVYLVRALVRTQGLEGLSDSLAVLRGFVEHNWDDVHPRLDPDDDNDPTVRVNTLAALSDADAVLRPVREAPLVSSRALGRFSLRDVQVATGALPAPPDGRVPELATIDAAFTDTELADLQATARTVDAALEAASAIETQVSDRVGAGEGVNLGELTKLLKAARHVVTDRLARRGVAEPNAVPQTESEAPMATVGTASAVAPPQASGPIRSRDDALRALDMVCDYFNQNEPSSPVPLLLQRAKRLVSKSFLDIVRDLAPDGLPQAERIQGPDPGK